MAEATASRSYAHSLLPIRASYGESTTASTGRLARGRVGRGIHSSEQFVESYERVVPHREPSHPGYLENTLGLASGSRASGGRVTPDAPELGVPTAVIAVEGGGSILASAHCWKEGWELGHPPAIAFTGLHP